MPENKKVLTTENLVTIKELNDSIYQEKLVDGETIKTINGQSLLGEGNIIIKSESGDASVTLLAPAWQRNCWYNNNDVISYNKKIYSCSSSHYSESSFNNNYWTEITVIEGAQNIAQREAGNYFSSNFSWYFNNQFNNKFNTSFDNRLNSQFDGKFDTRFDSKFEDKFNELMVDILDTEM